jgi:hypothetical protein
MEHIRCKLQIEALKAELAVYKQSPDYVKLVNDCTSANNEVANLRDTLESYSEVIRTQDKHLRNLIVLNPDFSHLSSAASFIERGIPVDPVGKTEAEVRAYTQAPSSDAFNKVATQNHRLKTVVKELLGLHGMTLDTYLDIKGYQDHIMELNHTLDQKDNALRGQLNFVARIKKQFAETAAIAVAYKSLYEETEEYQLLQAFHDLPFDLTSDLESSTFTDI